jgi:enediyne polyketide synthase
MVHAVRAVIAHDGDARFVVVQRGPCASSLARTLHLEHPEVTVCVVTIPEDHADAMKWVVAEVASAVGFVEARYERDGKRVVPVLALAAIEPPVESLRLGPQDVLLVTGGGKGIAAECALALARAGGTRLLIMGRSAPERDPELSENLSRMARAGLRVRYAMADVTDAEAVAAAVREAVQDLGPVTGVVHGAGTNVPRLLESLSVEDFSRTLAPKLDGAQHVLEAVDPARLRFFVTFGSVIARTGLRGEADYGLANEWMSRWVDELQERLPGCRCVSVEWSVWSGVGMGQRLGRLDSLADAGVDALGIDDAVAVLSRLIESGSPAPVVVAAGRLGHMPTLANDVTSLPLLRFLEDVRVYVPGVELVVDARLTLERDPYLEDHVFRGERILPAVIAMEAMAQAAMALGSWSQPPVFENIEFIQPIVAPPLGSLVLRVAALLIEPGCIQLVVRSASTAFQADHVRATATQASTPQRAGDGDRPDVEGMSEARATSDRSPHVLLDPARELYGGLLFHRGRFQRLTGYRSLRATECSADLMSDGAAAWFGDYLPERLVLGDPAARDAALHAIQACVPHRSLLPVSVKRVRCSVLDAHDRHSLVAIERAHDSEGFEYELSIRDCEGREVERWEGLRLAIVRGEQTGVPAAPALFGPYLERRLAELIPGAQLRVAIARGEQARPERSQSVSRELTGSEERLPRRPDGRPDPGAGGSLSVTHSGPLTIGVIAPDRAACDLQAVGTRESELWEGLLGRTYRLLAQELAREAAEDEQVAATRVWCVIECLKKRGASNAAPLAIESRHADGWVVLRSGDDVIATLAMVAASDRGALVLGVLASATDAAKFAERR